MSKETMFYNLCVIMANMEDTINTFQGIGMSLEPDEGIGKDLYNSASIAYRIASDLLDIWNVSVENEVFDIMMQMNKETVDDVSKQLWSKYGKKN